VVIATAAFLLLSLARAGACAACYGQSDSPLAAGMNWGIVSLLGIIGFVLGGVAAFGVYLARRASVLKATAGSPAPDDSIASK
jgi:hypothetical protein